MDLHQLKSFYYAANYLNFSKAAGKVSLSQPAVSRQIEALEGYYNLPLFKRNGRKIELTDAGRRLLQYAEKILLLTDETEKAMNALNNLEEGEINIGAGTTIGNYILPSLIMEFQEKHPGIRINLFINQTGSITEKLKNGELDMALVARTMNHPDFNYKAIMPDDILLLGVPSYKQRTIQNEVFILRKPGSNTRENTDQYFAEMGFTPEKFMEFDTNEAVKQAIVSGKGIGFLSEFVVKTEITSGILVPLQLNRQIQRYFSLIFPKGKFASPTHMIFSSFLKKNIHRL